MIANMLSVEQVLVCRVLLYSPPQSGYGTSCDKSCLGGDGISMISSISYGGKINSIRKKQVTEQPLGCRDLFFRLDGFQEDWISGTPCNSHCLFNSKIDLVGWMITI